MMVSKSRHLGCSRAQRWATASSPVDSGALLHIPQLGDKRVYHKYWTAGAQSRHSTVPSHDVCKGADCGKCLMCDTCFSTMRIVDFITVENRFIFRKLEVL